MQPYFHDFPCPSSVLPNDLIRAIDIRIHQHCVFVHTNACVMLLVLAPHISELMAIVIRRYYRHTVEYIVYTTTPVPSDTTVGQTLIRHVYTYTPTYVHNIIIRLTHELHHVTSGPLSPRHGASSGCRWRIGLQYGGWLRVY